MLEVVHSGMLEGGMKIRASSQIEGYGRYFHAQQQNFPPC